MHISISSLDAQCLIRPGDVSQVGHILVALSSHQNVQNPRMPQHYTNDTKNIAAKTAREEKTCEKAFVCFALFSLSSFLPLLPLVTK